MHLRRLIGSHNILEGAFDHRCEPKPKAGEREQEGVNRAARIPAQWLGTRQPRRRILMCAGLGGASVDGEGARSCPPRPPKRRRLH